MGDKTHEQIILEHIVTEFRNKEKYITSQSSLSGRFNKRGIKVPKTLKELEENELIKFSSKSDRNPLITFYIPECKKYLREEYESIIL